MAHVRPANPRDACRIIEMTSKMSAHERNAPSLLTVETLNRAAFSEKLLNIFVAESGDEVIGHIVLTKSLDMQTGAAAWWVAEIFVEAPHRRRGVGSALLAEAIRAVRAEGATFLQWLVAPDNAEAIAFYEHRGAKRDRGVAMFLDLRGQR